MMTKYQTGVLPLPWSTSVQDAKAIRAMEERGCTVILESKGDLNIVKVREAGHRQIREASTSGFPIRVAFAKWQERHGATV